MQNVGGNFMATLNLKRIFIYSTLVSLILGCKSYNDHSSLKNFEIILSQSDKVVIRFFDYDSELNKPLIKTISKSSVISELKDLMQQSQEDSTCNSIDGSMSFFSGQSKIGFLEFSVNPNCPAFYLHDSNKITKYKMSAFCGMFLESVRRGEK